MDEMVRNVASLGISSVVDNSWPCSVVAPGNNSRAQTHDARSEFNICIGEPMDVSMNVSVVHYMNDIRVRRDLTDRPRSCLVNLILA